MKYLTLLVFAGLLASGCSKKDGDSAGNAQADSMKTAYKAMLAAWDAGTPDELDKYLSPDYVAHNPMPGTKGNVNDMKDMMRMMKTGFPDMKTTVEDLRVDGDMLMARWTTAGTNSGTMMPGMPATNKAISNVMGIEMVRWKNGKFTESWFVMEDMKMMEQLGLMPSMSGGAPATDSTKKSM